jgi:proline racemase
MHTTRDFHSLVSLAAAGKGDKAAVDAGAFRASGVQETLMSDGTPAVVVRLEGKAWYTGMSVHVAEARDGIASDGFTLQLPN